MKWICSCTLTPGPVIIALPNTKRNRAALQTVFQRAADRRIFMKYNHIVFDVDGTLINTARNILTALKDALMTTDGLSYEISDLTFSLACPSVVTLDRLKVEDPDATLAVWIENEKKYTDMFYIFDGIKELLVQLRKSGCHLGIITSRTHEELELIFDALPLCQHFTTIICSDDVASPKPAPDPLLKYMEMTGADKSRILYVGDTLHDISCASAAGTASALAVWGTHEKEAPADYHPGTPEELGRLLLQDN